MSSYCGITLLLFVLIDGLNGHRILFNCGTLTASKGKYSEGDTVVIQFTPISALTTTHVRVRNWMRGTRQHGTLLYNSSATNNNHRYTETIDLNNLKATLSIDSVTVRDWGVYYLVCKQRTDAVEPHWMYSGSVTINISKALTTSTKAESPVEVAPTTSAGHPCGQSDQWTLINTLIAVISAAAAVVFVTVTVIVILIILRRRRKLSTKKTLRPTVSVENSRMQSTQDQGVAYEDLFIVQPQTQQYEVLQMTPQVPEGDVVSSDQGDDHQYIYVQV